MNQPKDVLSLDTDVLVLGGGPAGTWAAWSAAAQGARVVLADSELYCPTDALFVAPEAEQNRPIDEHALGLLGSYREAVGWGTGRVPGASRDQSFRLLPLFADTAGKKVRTP